MYLVYSILVGQSCSMCWVRLGGSAVPFPSSFFLYLDGRYGVMGVVCV